MMRLRGVKSSGPGAKPCKRLNSHQTSAPPHDKMVKSPWTRKGQQGCLQALLHALAPWDTLRHRLARASIDFRK